MLLQSVRCTFETKEDDGKLNVWVEPAECDGTGERPIKQLEVQVSNYIGISALPGSSAISACDDDGDAKWRVHWTIRRLSDKEEVLRSALHASKERQFRAYNFPTGVDASEMPEFWAGLNFSGTKPASQVAYRTENFRSASPSIQKLREVSRAGREETDWIIAKEAGKPKIIYGHEEPWTATPLMENAIKRSDKRNGDAKTQSTEALPGNGIPAYVPKYAAHDFSSERSLMETTTEEEAEE
ncbi:hypothetical protein AX15_000060 [Amanita polypyramis BW_CC]|nr:hypothetical protein AX15_000060 [Amanita polypyramis BW_CC]